MSIAMRIRDCRYVKGWGPDELAHRANISRTALYQIECGKTETPRAATLQRIAEALSVTIEDLMGKEAPSKDRPGRAESEASTPRSPSGGFSPRMAIGSERELDRKFHDLLASPLGEGFALLVHESHRLLPAREVG